MNRINFMPRLAAMPRLSTIRAKLLVVVAGTVLLAQIVSAGLSVWGEAERYAAQKGEALFASARVLAAASSQFVAAGDPRGAYGAIRGMGGIPGIVFVSVSGRDGRALASLGAAERLASDLTLDAASPPVGALLMSRTLELSVPVVEGGQRVGTLDLVADTSDLPERLWSAVGGVAIGGVAGLILALALALRLQQGITDPLRRLTSTMRKVKDSRDYSVAMTDTSADEVGVLIAGFNTMIGDIRDRDQKLQRHLEHLEQEVADRTRDFQAAAADAQSANQAKSDFLATMSHEIRTPMNGILVMAELLAGCDLPGRARRHADVIAKSGQSLLAIINDILDLSKIEAGKLDVETLDVEPVEAGETVLRLFAERARSRGLDLAGRVSLAPGALISADPVRLGQVLSNLVNNALKFTEAGSVTLAIGPEPGDAGRVRFSILDTGIGIEAGKLSTIFDAFSQADQTTTRRFGGTGLGLAIGRRLVAAMGGDLRVDSEPGRGSSFYFSLPLSARSRALAPPHVPGARPRAVVSLPGAATAASAASYFRDMGCDATTVEARALVDPHAVDLLLASPEYLRKFGRPALAAGGVVAALADPAAPADDLRADGIADFILQYPLSRAEIYEIGEWLENGRPLRHDISAAKVDDLGNFAGARVLVADDSAVNLEVAQAALARLGVSPKTVENGREAVEAFQSGAWDIILMDGSMPDMDGFEATRAIRDIEAREGRARLPIIALTAHVVGAAAEEWRAADMDGVLHKPYTLPKLAEILARHLRAAAPAVELAGPVDEPKKSPPKLLDRAALDGLREMSGDDALVARVARLYRDTAPARIAELGEAISRADVRGAASAAHALKSMSLNIGAQAVAAAAGDIERRARERDALADKAAFDQLSSLAEETFALLRRDAA